ncbi:MAG: hypothetical protein JSR26_06715 [Proteobacteria bacterium]|nr:hypothetical protein [Pseudomonadota bacterium]
MILIALAAGAAAAAPSVFAAPTLDVAHVLWHKSLQQNPAPATGCFHATYPSAQWVRDQCHATPYHYSPTPRPAFKGAHDVVGNGHDYAIAIKGLVSQAEGSFPTVRGVTSEQSVGVPAFGGGGILGPNEYTLQLNSNFAYGSSAACAGGNPQCLVWQQFIYAPDYAQQGSAAVFMQYWLIGYNAPCPSNFWDAGNGDCYVNSDYVPAPDIPATQLAQESITASAATGGNDTVTFTYGNTAYSVSAPDNMVYLASVWNGGEFNVVGNAGGSEAVFNRGSFMQVKLAITDGSTAAPYCLQNYGTTGETNNLNLMWCSARSAAAPYIQFTQLN